MLKYFESFSVNKKQYLILALITMLTLVTIPFANAKWIATSFVIIGLCVAVFIGVILFFKPIVSVYLLIGYCFLLHFFSREIGGGIPYGIGVELLLTVAFVAFGIRASKDDWNNLNTNLMWLMFGWFVLSVMQLVNPAGASPRGWVQEIRSTAVYPLLIVGIGFLAFRTLSDVNNFIWFVLVFSFLATLNGLKQQFIGLSSGEQQFLVDGGAVTHVLFGKLRVFSFYSDAGQFGASQAHIGAMAAMLAFGKIKWWKRLALLVISLLSIYGMLISGTRGALFALLVALFFGIFLSKNIKVLVFGSMVMLLGVGILKYTSIGNANYEIYRLRTALDPEDASLNTRFINQQKLHMYLKSRPFGGGLGVIGANGKEYNADKFLSTVEPDSYWVKVWAMYGIVGFTLWFCAMMFLLGKGAAIIWRLRDVRLRTNCVALLSGVAGIFFCSYGNEVINTMPSTIITYLSLVFVFLAPKLDKEIVYSKI